MTKQKQDWRNQENKATDSFIEEIDRLNELLASERQRLIEEVREMVEKHTFTATDPNTFDSVFVVDVDDLLNELQGINEKHT